MAETKTSISKKLHLAKRDDAVGDRQANSPELGIQQSPARSFDIPLADGRLCPIGTVVSIVETVMVAPANGSYDRLVVGVVLESFKDQRGNAIARVATSGVVQIRAGLQAGQIVLGDLLIASNSPGIAIRARDPYRAIGAIVAKALQPVNWSDAPDGAECLIYALVMH